MRDIKDGWITNMDLVWIPKSYNIDGVNQPLINQNFSYRRFPKCAVCNRFVEGFEQSQRFDTHHLIIFRARCHGREEQKEISGELLRENPNAVFELVSRPWFMADYEKLKAAQPQPKAEPPKVPSLLDKPTRQIDLE